MTRLEKIKNWVKAHKKELLISGAITIVGGIIIINNKETILKWFENGIPKMVTSHRPKNVAACSASKIAETVVEESIQNASPATRTPFKVSEHVRNLPKGWHPSKEKVAYALANGYTLGENQTFVRGYTKGMAAAA